MLNCINGLSIRKVEKQCAGDSENKRSYEAVNPRRPNAIRDQYAIISSLPSLWRSLERKQRESWSLWSSGMLQVVLES